MKCLELSCKRAAKTGGLCYRHERRMKVYRRVVIPGGHVLQRKFSEERTAGRAHHAGK